MRIVFPLLQRRRHPLAQALSVILGLIMIAILMVCGLVVAGVLAVGGVLWLGWRQWQRSRVAMPGTARKAQQPHVLEGEYVVIRRSRPAAHR